MFRVVGQLYRWWQERYSNSRSKTKEMEINEKHSKVSITTWWWVICTTLALGQLSSWNLVQFCNTSLSSESIGSWILPGRFTGTANTTHTTHHTTCPNSFRDCLSAKKSENDQIPQVTIVVLQVTIVILWVTMITLIEEIFIYLALYCIILCLNLSNKQHIKTKRLYELKSKKFMQKKVLRSK